MRATDLKSYQKERLINCKKTNDDYVSKLLHSVMEARRQQSNNNLHKRTTKTNPTPRETIASKVSMKEKLLKVIITSTLNAFKGLE